MTDQQQQPATPPSNAAEAQTRLTTLTADTAWGKKLFAGDADTRREYDSLTEMAASGDMIENAIAGIIPGEIPSSDQKHMTETASWLRDVGIRDEVIRETLSERPVTNSEFNLVTAWKSQKMSSPEFTKRYLAGEPEKVKQITLANIVLSSNIKMEIEK